jgi:inner membrane protein
MPTFLSHPAVPVALGAGLGEAAVSRRLLVAGAAASLLPDLDVLGFFAGVPYGSAFGHRGATHSLAAALAVALAGAALHRPLRTTARTAFLFLLAAAASHGLLDALTNGGLGVALLWPLSDARFFAPVRPIEVAPLRRVLGARALAALGSEVVRVWAPAAVVGVALAARRLAARRGRAGA